MLFPDELDIGDFFVIAEHQLGVTGEELKFVTRIPEAESALAAPFANFEGVYFYPDPLVRGAVCCSRIVRNHPLPDGNKRVGYLCMVEMFYRSGTPWPDAADREEQLIVAVVIEGLAARTMAERDFIGWVRTRSAS